MPKGNVDTWSLYRPLQDNSWACKTKPDVDDISGLSPAISIEQKGISHNPRSTVGTVTEIYDYLRLLYGRAGTPYCHICGREVHSYTVDEIVELVLNKWPDRRLSILAPVVKGKKGAHKNIFLRLRLSRLRKSKG